MKCHHYLLAFLISLSGAAHAQTAPEKFASGVQAYRNKDYQKAKDELLIALKITPNSPSTLYNLGLSEYKLEQKGWALAHLRLALSLDPGYLEAQRAYDLFAAHIDRPFAAHDSSNWEVLRNNFLRPISTATYLAIMAILLLLSGWLLIGFFGHRKTALRDEQPLPPFPAVGFILAGLLVVSIFMNLAKMWDHLTPRGTILANKTEVKSGPTADTTTLFELNEGNEVILKDAAETWAQITYPGGMTGWVLKEHVLPTSGRHVW
jgi:tetratricopeptide (TPR) repeat protein